MTETKRFHDVDDIVALYRADIITKEEARAMAAGCPLETSRAKPR